MHTHTDAVGMNGSGSSKTGGVEREKNITLHFPLLFSWMLREHQTHSDKHFLRVLKSAVTARTHPVTLGRRREGEKKAPQKTKSLSPSLGSSGALPTAK